MRFFYKTINISMLYCLKSAILKYRILLFYFCTFETLIFLTTKIFDILKSVPFFYAFLFNHLIYLKIRLNILRH